MRYRKGMVEVLEMLVACVGLYGERVEQAMKCITRLIPYVDRYIVIVDETVTDEQRTVLKDSGCEVYFHSWEDSMVKMRNQYLEKVQTDDWCIVHDPDEWFNEQFCKDARKLCETADTSSVRDHEGSSFMHIIKFYDLICNLFDIHHSSLGHHS